MKKKISIALFIFCFICSGITYSQEVYQNIDNKGIYDFIDELANCGIITVNSAIKPYSRKIIAEKLKEASEKPELLNKRQNEEVEFYLLDYAKELSGFETTDFLGKNCIMKEKVPFRKRIDIFYYKDSLFNFTINPVMGLEYFSNENGTNYHRWNGLEAYGYAGKHWGFFSSLRDNHETELFALPDYLTQQTGGTYKKNGIGGDYEKVTGGITYSWNWGSFGIMKDNIEWGNNYNGANIISNRTVSFPFIKLNMHPAKWFDFNYIHGWLPSLVVDSNRTYNYGNGDRIIYYDKYIAANMFTFTPFKNLNFSFGNSIIYSDNGVQLGFLIPVIFFKSVDHSMNGMNNYAGQNAQMFFDISSRQIKHLHLYASLFVDEISISNMTDKEKQTNFISFKCGFALSDFYLQNLTLIAEYTRSNPLVYEHFIPTTTFESNGYILGHYLEDNAEECFFALHYNPVKKFRTSLSYCFARKGPDYIYDGVHHDHVMGLPWLSTVTWYNKTASFKISYQAFNDIYIFCGYSNAFVNDKFNIYSPAYFRGNTNTFSFGMNWGY